MYNLPGPYEGTPPFTHRDHEWSVSHTDDSFDFCDHGSVMVIDYDDERIAHQYEVTFWAFDRLLVLVFWLDTFSDGVVHETVDVDVSVRCARTDEPICRNTLRLNTAHIVPDDDLLELLTWE